MSVRNLGFLLFACCALPLHAGFLGSTCVGDGCSNAIQNTALTQGSTTFTYANSFTGIYVGGKPTLGTFDQLTVDDANGVPFTNPTTISSANMNYTDTLSVGTVASNYTFTFGLHVINSLNSYPNGFDSVFTSLTLNLTGRDQFGNMLWHTTTFSFQPVTVTQQGGSTQTVVYNTGPTFYSPLLSSMDLSLTLSSNVWYSNYNYLTYPNPGRTYSTHVSAFSDASNTVTLQSIEAKDSQGTPTGDLIGSANGAYYSTQSQAASTPEPGSIGLALGGVLLLIARQRRK
jgi:MYXO-CTERM domain-containing protein